MSKNLLAAIVATAGLVSSASASVTITQGPTAPTYTNTLTFDEPGGTTGVNVPSNSWVGMGITSIVSGEGSNFVGPNAFPTAQSTNSYYGPYGVFIRFATDLTAASFNAWDSSGPPTFSGGGMAVVLINDGDENNPVGFDFFTPAYGGFGDSAFNITTSGGMVFDEIRVLGFGFFPETYVDNVSWNAVPAPSVAALLSLAGLSLVRRRRN
jgi:hypothetical protein